MSQVLTLLTAFEPQKNFFLMKKNTLFLVSRFLNDFTDLITNFLVNFELKKELSIIFILHLLF